MKGCIELSDHTAERVAEYGHGVQAQVLPDRLDVRCDDVEAQTSSHGAGTAVCPVIEKDHLQILSQESLEAESQVGVIGARTPVQHDARTAATDHFIVNVRIATVCKHPARPSWYPISRS